MVSNNTVFLPNHVDSVPDQVLAFDAATGQTKWKIDFPRPGLVSELTYDNNKLYLYFDYDDLKKKSYTNILVEAYDAETGKNIYSTPARMACCLYTSQSPVIVENQLFLGTFNTEQSFNLNDGKLQWNAKALSGRDSMAAVTNQFVIRGQESAITLLDRQTGKTITTIPTFDTNQGHLD